MAREAWPGAGCRGVLVSKFDHRDFCGRRHWRRESIRRFFRRRQPADNGVNWTFPTMSVVLEGKKSRAILAEPGYTQPFDSRHPPDIAPFKSGGTIYP